MTSIWKWESGNLQIKKSLLDGLQITETAKEVISVVGAGGKTTTIRRLTDEMEKRQKNVAVTTTTRMKKEPHFLLGADAERITQRWGQTHQVWFGEQDDNPEKVRGVSEALLDEVRKYGPDLFLIEADGARRLPCKVPESWEPVIYQKSTRVLAVYGLDAVGKTMRYQVILNKADTRRRRQFAQEICRELEKRGFADVTVTAEGRQEEE